MSIYRKSAIKANVPMHDKNENAEHIDVASRSSDFQGL